MENLEHRIKILEEKLGTHNLKEENAFLQDQVTSQHRAMDNLHKTIRCNENEIGELQLENTELQNKLLNTCDKISDLQHNLEEYLIDKKLIIRGYPE